jgi:hypothetical protein
MMSLIRVRRMFQLVGKKVSGRSTSEMGLLLLIAPLVTRSVKPIYLLGLSVGPAMVSARSGGC